MSDEVLAKSKRGETSVTLLEHTQDVRNAFAALFGTSPCPTRLARCWLRFFRLNDIAIFIRHGNLACCLHDIGKSNSRFQSMVQGGSTAQTVYHEHLSALLLHQENYRELFASCDVDFDLILATVAGHHLRANQMTFGDCQTSIAHRFTVIGKGIREVLELAGVGKGIDEDVIADQVWSYDSGARNDVTARGRDFRRHFQRWRRTLNKKEVNEPTQRLLIAVRAALIVADAAGSGLVRISSGENRRQIISDWIRNAFDAIPFDAAGIRTSVITPRIKAINKQCGRDENEAFPWHDFQDAAAELGRRTLLLAGCGSGKTLAAWRWIEAQAAKRPVSRVIFLYPTRATATEGFRDYVSWAPEAALVSGTAAYELDGMFENPTDERTSRKFETDDRLYAIAYWQRRIFSATVDQFLGFMQHSYRSMCLLPMLVDSIVVFDEVHSFDPSLFSAFRSFLKAFDVPVLAMTASLPTERIRVLTGECKMTVFPKAPEQFADLYERSRMDRYTVKVVTQKEVDSLVKQALTENLRILWVVNTVQRCQEIARSYGAICYHSGFTLNDRKQRHKEVIAAFQPPYEGAVLAVTTQVCEMSLDLDADVLITEAAPIPALIQRMGRCNRHAQPCSGKLGQAIIYEPDNLLPYSDSDMTGVAEFLASIKNQTVGQLHLQELLEKHGSNDAEAEKYNAFLQSGPWAVAYEEPLRDPSNHSVQAILDRDVSSFFEMQLARQPTDGFILPAPRRMAVPCDRLPRWLQTVPAALYCSEYGLDRSMNLDAMSTERSNHE